MPREQFMCFGSSDDNVSTFCTAHLKGPSGPEGFSQYLGVNFLEGEVGYFFDNGFCCFRFAQADLKSS